MNRRKAKVLELAEKEIAEECRAQRFALEIDDAMGKATKYLSSAEAEEMRGLYRTAKRNNPEIWDCAVEGLSDEAFKGNIDFFELVCKVQNLEFLATCYPERMAELVEMGKRWDFVDFMYWRVRHWCEHHDIVPKYRRIDSAES